MLGNNQGQEQVALEQGNLSTAFWTASRSHGDIWGELIPVRSERHALLGVNQ